MVDSISNEPPKNVPIRQAKPFGNAKRDFTPIEDQSGAPMQPRPRQTANKTGNKTAYKTGSKIPLKKSTNRQLPKKSQPQRFGKRVGKTKSENHNPGQQQQFGENGQPAQPSQPTQPPQLGEKMFGRSMPRKNVVEGTLTSGREGRKFRYSRMYFIIFKTRTLLTEI